jgi:hypothetical protein
VDLPPGQAPTLEPGTVEVAEPRVAVAVGVPLQILEMEQLQGDPGPPPDRLRAMMEIRAGPALITSAASSCSRLPGQASRPPVDCVAISVHTLADIGGSQPPPVLGRDSRPTAPTEGMARYCLGPDTLSWGGLRLLRYRTSASDLPPPCWPSL